MWTSCCVEFGVHVTVLFLRGSVVEVVVERGLVLVHLVLEGGRHGFIGHQCPRQEHVETMWSIAVDLSFNTLLFKNFYMCHPI